MQGKHLCLGLFSGEAFRLGIRLGIGRGRWEACNLERGRQCDFLIRFGQHPKQKSLLPTPENRSVSRCLGPAAAMLNSVAYPGAKLSQFFNWFKGARPTRTGPPATGVQMATSPLAGCTCSWSRVWNVDAARVHSYRLVISSCALF